LLAERDRLQAENRRLNEALGCPICGRYPIDVNCVRDWLNAKEMPLHNEWQQRMTQYANEIIKLREARATIQPQQEGEGKT